MEPDFSAEMWLISRSDAARMEWFRDKARIFAADGARWHRFSSDPGNPSHLFYDGWRMCPPADCDATDDREFLGLDVPGAMNGHAVFF